MSATEDSRQTDSGIEIKPVYTEEDTAGLALEAPGEFPYTRGLHPTGYRGRTWTIRQFSGFGNAQQTNARYKMLLGAGGGGLSVAFDMPTLMGRDSDEPQSLGEVGHCGVAIDSAADMEVLFDGIPLADTTTSMTISGPAVPVFCMYLVAAERQGADLRGLDGTLQTDIFKEYIAQKEWLFPPEPHLRLIGDLMEYCGTQIQRYKPLSVSRVPSSTRRSAPWRSAATRYMQNTGTAGPEMVMLVVTSARGMPSKRSSMSATESIATPQCPTSPRLFGSSESRPIRVGMSNATLSPPPPRPRIIL